MSPRATEQDIRERVRAVLGGRGGAAADPSDHLGARFDAGLAWVHFPVGCGGLGADRSLQRVVEDEFAAAGLPPLSDLRNPIGLGMVAPTLVEWGSPAHRRAFLRRLWTGEDIWCQLFSEPGAGSDLAGLATRAHRDGDGWRVSGQKVWTSGAHLARWAILLARTDPAVPKHQGLTFFICDMTAPGVEVRPLRQITGQAEFNEVFLDDVHIPDGMRLGAAGEGWAVARTTLANERVSLGATSEPREGGLIERVARLWRERPELRTPETHAELLRLWVDCEAGRLANARLAQRLASGRPGAEGAAAKLNLARRNQDVARLWVRLLGGEGLLYDDWTPRRVSFGEEEQRGSGYFYLRTRANSIEGGTSEVLRTIVADRVLELPREPRTDNGIPWKDVPR